MSWFDRGSKTWRFRFRDDRGVWRSHGGLVSKRLADDAHTKLKERWRMIKAGILEPATESAKELRAKPINDLIESYAAHKLKEGATAKSCETMRLRLKVVMALGKIKTLGDINTTTAVAALDAYKEERGAAERTVKGALTFIRMMLKHYKISPDPTADVNLPKTTKLVHDRRAATGQEIAMLRGAARRAGSSKGGWKPWDREALIVLTVATGMRRGDMIGMTVADIVLDGCEPRVIGRAASSKNREPFVQPLDTETAAWLRAWVGTRSKTALLFPALTAKSNTWAIIRRCCEAAGVPYKLDGKYLDFHALRHTYITGLGRNGTDVRTVMDLARHKNISTTQRYMHTNDELRRAAVERLNGGAA
jgi:integrase/recombinase XerD